MSMPSVLLTACPAHGSGRSRDDQLAPWTVMVYCEEGAADGRPCYRLPDHPGEHMACCAAWQERTHALLHGQPAALPSYLLAGAQEAYLDAARDALRDDPTWLLQHTPEGRQAAVAIADLQARAAALPDGTRLIDILDELQSSLADGAPVVTPFPAPRLPSWEAAPRDGVILGPLPIYDQGPAPDPLIECRIPGCRETATVRRPTCLQHIPVSAPVPGAPPARASVVASPPANVPLPPRPVGVTHYVQCGHQPLRVRWLRAVHDLHGVLALEACSARCARDMDPRDEATGGMIGARLLALRDRILPVVPPTGPLWGGAAPAAGDYRDPGTTIPSTLVLPCDCPGCQRDALLWPDGDGAAGYCWPCVHGNHGHAGPVDRPYLRTILADKGYVLEYISVPDPVTGLRAQERVGGGPFQDVDLARDAARNPDGTYLRDAVVVL